MLKRKKGFSLIELLAVIVIIAIIAVITIPIVNGLVQRVQKEACIASGRMAKKAADNYLHGNIETSFPKDGQVLTVTIGELVESGNLTAVLDPATKEKINYEESKVEIANMGGMYEYTATLISPTCSGEEVLELPEGEYKNDAVYYTGENPDNWVLFGRMDESSPYGILWRIVKTDQGGVKLIYEGLENGGEMPAENGRIRFEHTAGVPYSTNSHNYFESSTVFQQLKNWEKRLIILERDRFLKGTDWKIGKIPNFNPTYLDSLYVYEILEDGSALGRSSLSTIGLLNITDYMHTSTNLSCNKTYVSGGMPTCAFSGNIVNNFLYKDKYHYWTMNGVAGTENQSWYINNAGQIVTGNIVNGTIGVRPVINLQNNISFISGSGTLDDPYMLEDYMTTLKDGPLITLHGQNNITLRQGEHYVEEGASAFDEEDGNLTEDIVIESDVNTNVPGTYKITYNVTDSNGNNAPEVTRTVMVKEIDSPVITLKGNNPMRITIGNPYEEPGVTAYDPYYGDLSDEILATGEVLTDFLGVYEITYTVENIDGKTDTKTRRVIVEPSRPVLILNGTNPTILRIGGSYTELSATATDSVDGDLTGSISRIIKRYETVGTGNHVQTIETIVNHIEVDLKYRYNIEYKVTNSFGITTKKVRSVMILPDNGPTITFSPNGKNESSKSVSVKINVFEKNHPINVASLRYLWIDENFSLGPNQTLENAINQPFNNGVTVHKTGVTGLIRLYAIAKDIHGNTTVATSNVYRLDNFAPTINLNGSHYQRILVTTPYVELGATAYDQYYDGDLTNKISRVGTVNYNVPGSYAIHYQVEDSVGNKASVRRTVEIYTAKPELTLNGNRNMKVLIDTPYHEPGANASDEVDGNITNQIQISGTVNTGVAGKYTVIYTVANSYGRSTTLSREVEVYLPEPQITMIGNNPHRHKVTTPYIDPGVTASDEKDGNLTSSITMNSNVTPNMLGTYTVVYEVTNSYHITTKVTRNVIVYAEKPIITLNGNQYSTVLVGDAWVDPGASASDVYDGNLTSLIVRSGGVNINKVGVYRLTYEVENSYGEKAIITRTVQVREANINIELSGNNPHTMKINEPYEEPGFIATHEKLGDITQFIQKNSNITEHSPGKYTVEYRYHDVNMTQPYIVKRTVIIEEPNITVTFGGNNPTRLLVGQPYVELGVTAIDEFDGNISSSVVVSNNINPTREGIYTVTYEFTNSFGYQKKVSRTVIYRLSEITITLNGELNITLMLGTPFVDPGATAIDEVDGDITSSLVVNGNINPNVLGTYQITYEFTNSYGTKEIQTRTVIYRYPEITLQLLGASIMTLPIGGNYQELGATAMDERDGDISHLIIMESQLNPLQLGIYSVTYTVTSPSGLTKMIKRTVEVIAQPGPNISFTANGNQWATSHTVSALVTKNYGDLVIGSFRYQWINGVGTPLENSFVNVYENDTNVATPVGVSGAYYLWILAKDEYGNTSMMSSPVQRLDNEKPTITLKGKTVVEIPIDGVYEDTGVTLIDHHSGIKEETLIMNSTVNTGILGTYEVTYQVADNVGHISNIVKRTVVVVQKPLKPAPGPDFVQKYYAEYFVGENPDNWLIFGNAANNPDDDYVPIYWRIVKSDSDGIKIIYEGTKNGNENGNVGVSRFGNNGNYQGSDIQIMLQNWYTNISETNKELLVSPTQWCMGTIPSPYHTDVMKENECLVKSSSSPIGLLVASDYLSTTTSPCSGYGELSCGSQNFLKKNYHYFTMNGDQINTGYVFTPNSNGALTVHVNTQELVVRPIINLKEGVLIKAGDGSYEDPYILNTREAVIDNEPPVIEFNPSTYITNQENGVQVIVRDEITGVDPNTLFYVWTTTTTRPNNNVFIHSFENGEFIKQEEGEGYLHILAKDRKGNEAYVYSGRYLLDMTSPILNIPETTTLLNSQVAGFNLMTGVTVSDDTDANVQLSVSGNLPDLPGIYPITYTAVDHAGNQTIKIRTVRVTYPVLSLGYRTATKVVLTDLGDLALYRQGREGPFTTNREFTGLTPQTAYVFQSKIVNSDIGYESEISEITVTTEVNVTVGQTITVPTNGYTIPSHVLSVKIEAHGGRGGNGAQGSREGGVTGSNGTRISGILNYNTYPNLSRIITKITGNVGAGGAGVYHTSADNSTVGRGGGGGGATLVRVGGTTYLRAPGGTGGAGGRLITSWPGVAGADFPGGTGGTGSPNGSNGTGVLPNQQILSTTARLAGGAGGGASYRHSNLQTDTASLTYSTGTVRIVILSIME